MITDRRTGTLTAEERNHLPDADELTALLRTYFVPPITPAHVEPLLRWMKDLIADRPSYSGETSAYEGIDRYDYTAWMREYARGRREYPSISELTLFSACRLKDFPRPKSFCPEKYCGTWREVEGPNVGSIWRLSPQGGMQIEGATPFLNKTTAWCEHPGKFLMIAERPDRWTGIFVRAVAEDTMKLEWDRYKKVEPHRFERISHDHGLPDVWVTI